MGVRTARIDGTAGQTGAVEHRIEVRVDAGPDSVTDALADLTTYPEWNDLVVAADPVPTVDGDPGPAFSMTLRGRIGPFARSKQLRMVRLPPDPGRVRFERRELDGRHHAAWVMDASVTPVHGGGSAVELILRYDGGLWSSALEALLSASIDRATVGLPAFLNRR